MPLSDRIFLALDLSSRPSFKTFPQVTPTIMQFVATNITIKPPSVDQIWWRNNFICKESLACLILSANLRIVTSSGRKEILAQL